MKRKYGSKEKFIATADQIKDAVTSKSLTELIKRLSDEIYRGIPSANDKNIWEMNSGDVYLKDGKVYICNTSNGSSNADYEAITIGADGIHQIGYSTTDGSYNNTLVGLDSDKMPLAPTGFDTMTPAQVISWAGSSTRGILYDNDTKAIWQYTISGVMVSELCFGSGTVKRREGISGGTFGAWWDFRGAPIVYVDDTTATLSPNIYYIFSGTPASLTITFDTPLALTYVCEYMFEFTSGPSAATQLTLPNTVLWQETPEIETDKKYQVSIVNNVALIVGVDVV